VPETTVTVIDLGPAAAEVARLAAGVRDSHLDAPTPCGATTVAGLLGHIVGLTTAFRHAAEKVPVPSPDRPTPPPTAPADWRERVPAQLDALVAAWRQPRAWEGEATAGGVTMPAAQMGVVVLDELVLHGWDLAVATGQPFRCRPEDIAVVLGFTTQVAASGPAAREGLFGPPVPVPTDASPLDRALGLAGRDPDWTAPASEV
jgi:uncharacterized protein (TIGR03086 family)